MNISFHLVSDERGLRSSFPDPYDDLTALVRCSVGPDQTIDERMMRKYHMLQTKIALAGSGGRIIGVAMLVPFHIYPVHIIYNVAVLPEFRRRGIAKRLVEMLLGVARAMQGVKCVKLNCRAENEAAKGLYASCGFVRVFAYNGEDVYVHGFGKPVREKAWRNVYDLERRLESVFSAPSR